MGSVPILQRLAKRQAEETKAQINSVCPKLLTLLT